MALNTLMVHTFRTKLVDLQIYNIYHNMKLHKVAFILLIIGGLNWGLAAVGYNVVNLLLGSWPVVEQIVYILVGLAAIYEVVTHKKNCKDCGSGATV